jgi:hypothetical protein
MGYYTDYKLAMFGTKDAVGAFIATAEEGGVATEYGAYFVAQVLSRQADSVKWYGHRTDMLAISKQFPDIGFCLTGEGEEAGDLWQRYFKDGQDSGQLKGVVTYPKFDVEKFVVVS